MRKDSGMSTRYMHEKAEANPSFSRSNDPMSEGDRKEENNKEPRKKQKG
jgi:hypothetical protein